MNEFDHSAWGRFHLDASHRMPWHGRILGVPLFLDSPEALQILASAEGNTEAWLANLRGLASAELVTHGNWCWEDRTPTQIAGSLRLVRVEARSTSGKLSLFFEDGAPVTADASAEFGADGRLLFAGFTNRIGKPIEAAEERVVDGAGVCKLIVDRWECKLANCTVEFWSEQECAPFFKLLPELAKKLPGLIEEAKNKCAEDLLELARSWQKEAAQEGRPAAEDLTAELFKSKLGGCTASLPDGYPEFGLSIDFCFEDGEMFWGHEILVGWHEKDGWNDADIAG